MPHRRVPGPCALDSDGAAGQVFDPDGAFPAFITSLDEVVISMLVSGGDNATITRRMFNSLRDQLDPTIAAISTCLIVVSVTALIGVQLIGRRKDKVK